MTTAQQLELTLEPLVHATPDATLTIQQRFAQFDVNNPWVYRALEHLTEDWLAAGHKRVGIKQMFEVIRWTYGRRTSGDGGSAATTTSPRGTPACLSSAIPSGPTPSRPDSYEPPETPARPDAPRLGSSRSPRTEEESRRPRHTTKRTGTSQLKGLFHEAHDDLDSAGNVAPRAPESHGRGVHALCRPLHASPPRLLVVHRQRSTADRERRGCARGALHRPPPARWQVGPMSTPTTTTGIWLNADTTFSHHPGDIATLGIDTTHTELRLVMGTALAPEQQVAILRDLIAAASDLADALDVAPVGAECRACRGTGQRVHGWALCPRDCDDCSGTGRKDVAPVGVRA